MRQTLFLILLVFFTLGTRAQNLPIIDVHLQMQDDIMPKGPPIYPADISDLPDTIGMAVEAIESANFLAEEQKRDNFYNKAAEFLRLSEEEIRAHHQIAVSR